MAGEEEPYHPYSLRSRRTVLPFFSYSLEDDEDSEELFEEPKARNYKKKPNSSVVQPKRRKKNNKVSRFVREEIEELELQYPGLDWGYQEEGERIQFINKENPLILKKTIQHSGAVFCIQFSPSLELAATCSNLGTIRIWNTQDWSLIAEFRDDKEKEIEEFYNVCWSEDGKLLAAAGKLKSRSKWSEQDDDNHILPCPIKIFSVCSGSVLLRLSGHQEEIVDIKSVTFKGDNYLLTCSEDGRIIKWKMGNNWRTLLSEEWMDDETTYYAIHLSFVPNTGNKYFIAACDDGIKLYDFDAAKLVQIWSELYSYMCDCVKFIFPEELPVNSREYYVLSKGVELLKDEGKEVIFPNKAILHKLTLPKEDGGEFNLEEVCRFENEHYHANLWLLRLASNGRYVAAPTTSGQVFIWNLRSKQLTAVLSDHENEVRDIFFHPQQKVLVTCGEDSKINIYIQHIN